MWKIQRPDGIVEGWHGDGNFARTSIMYGLWKTRGVHAEPWRDDLILGAEMSDGKLFLALTSPKVWQGKLLFDFKRHRENLHLPIDYPRINQFQEWFVAEPEFNYHFKANVRGLKNTFSGTELRNGIAVELKPGEKLLIEITKLKR